MIHVPDMSFDLIPVLVSSSTSHQSCMSALALSNNADILENGFRIQLAKKTSLPSENASSFIMSTTDDSHTLQGLSGGQQTLVGLALLFSCALGGKRSPVYFLDEIDSSLDENNQDAIAKTVCYGIAMLSSLLISLTDIKNI